MIDIRDIQPGMQIRCVDTGGFPFFKVGEVVLVNNCFNIPCACGCKGWVDILGGLWMLADETPLKAEGFL